MLGIIGILAFYNPYPIPVLLAELVKHRLLMQKVGTLNLSWVKAMTNQIET